MRSVSLLSALAAASAVQAGPAEPRQASVTPITVVGNAFFKGNERFYVRGIAYQPGGSSAELDPLANPKICLPDLENFKELGVNVVRVYSTDNTLDHSECVNAYAAAGIYLVLDVNNPNYSINRDEPAPSYNAAYLQSVFATIDEFAKYPNVMAFFTGNEVIHDKVENTIAARYVKATTRDMKQYMRQRSPRNVLVGYSAADVSQNRLQAAAYFNCGTDDARSDFFAFNDYSWCSSDFQTSGWDQKVKNFTGYGVPIFLSEYGCIKNARDFGEVEALMSTTLMTHVYSGGLMFEYSNETNGFGIVEIPGPKTDQTAPRTKLPEFSAFAKALSANPAPPGGAGFTSTSASSPCPTKDANWLVDSSLLPALPEAAKKYFASGAGKGPGLNGPGSQNAGSTSTGDAPPGSGTEGASPSKSSNAAGGAFVGPMDKAPFMISAGIFMLTMLGAILL